MPTDFKNELYFDDASAGEITTVTTLNVWDCEAGRWSNENPVIIRNALLFALYPKNKICIGQIRKTNKNPYSLNPFTTPKGTVLKLDLASNSRTHGRFTFSEKPIGHYYFGREPWRRIIYGSILHTGCKKLTYYVSTYAITDDENRDEDGDQFDCPPLNINFETGDSHAKANTELMQLIEDLGNPTGNPIQYRSALFGQWIGKGTVAYGDTNDIYGINFAQPHSSMKGRKPELGSYQGKILYGKVFTAEKRFAKPGWMLFQWFPFDILELDGLISKMEQKCQEIVNAQDNMRNMAKFLKIVEDEAEAQLSDPDDNFTSIAEYENMMIRIIRVDVNSLLLLHPYLVRRIKWRLQSYWLNLAKSAGMRFFSVMTMPDEHFARYYAVNPDGRIVGGKKFCAPDFNQGWYIVFANPMRHWGDVQIWENVWEGDYLADTGVLATGKDLLLSLGRDTDGDYVQIAWADSYPNIRNAIQQFDESPATEKLPKVALKGTLQEIAIGSMNDLTGVVATLLGRSAAAGVNYHIQKIPAQPPYYPEETEQTIIGFLSQQLQIAVDSLKSAYPNHNAGLNVVKAYLDSVEKDGIPWLRDFKQTDCYLNRPCAVNANAQDTISRLVKLVNSYYVMPNYPMGNPRDYIDTLFADVDEYNGDPVNRNFMTPHIFQINYARDKRNEYWNEIQIAKRWREENDHDDSLLRKAAEKARQQGQEVFSVEYEGRLFEPRTWLRAYWYVSHDVNSGDGAFVFNVFPDEIVHELENTQEDPMILLIAYGTQFSVWAPNKWTEEEVMMRVVFKEFKGKQKKAVEIMNPRARIHVGFHFAGWVADKWKGRAQVGESRKMMMFTLRQTPLPVKLTKSVIFFDPNYYDRDQMRDLINKELYGGGLKP